MIALLSDSSCTGSLRRVGGVRAQVVDRREDELDRAIDGLLHRVGETPADVVDVGRLACDHDRPGWATLRST